MPRFEPVFSVGWVWPSHVEISEAIFKKNSIVTVVTNMYAHKILVVECAKRPVDIRRYGIRWIEIE